MQFPWILKKPELEEDLILTLNLLYPELHLNYFKNVNFYTNQDSIDRPGCTYPYYCHGNHNALLDQDWLRIWVNLLSKLVYELIKQIKSVKQPIHFDPQPAVPGASFELLYTNQDSIDRPGCTYPDYLSPWKLYALSEFWTKIDSNYQSKFAI